MAAVEHLQGRALLDVLHANYALLLLAVCVLLVMGCRLPLRGLLFEHGLGRPPGLLRTGIAGRAPPGEKLLQAEQFLVVVVL